MEQRSPQEATQQRRETLIRNLHEIAFCWNIASAFGYGFLLCVISSLNTENPRSDLGYYFLRAAVRIDDFLHLEVANSVTTHGLARQASGGWDRVGQELAILVSVLGATAVLLLILRLIPASQANRSVFGRLSFLTSLFALPASYMYVWGVPLHSVQNPWQPGPSQFRQTTFLAVALAEVLCLGIHFFLRPAKSASWALGAFLTLHFGFWVSVIWVDTPVSFLVSFRGPITPYLLLAAGPASAIVWLLYQKGPHLAADARNIKKRPGRWTIASALVSSAVLLAVWFPGRDYSLSRAKDPQSITVEFSRGPCYGMCSAYSVSIHGSGLVEYEGYSDVRVHGRETATISREQFMRILQKLDGIHFFTLEDRAFMWAFDTASVGVSVSIDGKTKSVVSDDMVFGPKEGHKAQFVRVANEIDDIVGSARWVKCPGFCR